MDTQQYCFGDFELDLGSQQLRRLGVPVHLERRPFELLVLLVTRHGQLVTRDEVIRQLWPGNVVIEFDTGLNTLVRKVRKALGDSPDAPTFIETVSGRGYRFIAPATQRGAAHADQPPATFDAKETTVDDPEKRPRNPLPRTTLVAVIVLAIAALGITVWRNAGNETQEIRLAVLPFENLTGQSDLDYLASGLADDTATSMSQIDLQDLAIIGGVSAQAVTRSALPLQEIGRAHDIDYFVRSSLRQEGSRVRVTAHLIRVADSTQVWSATFDRELTNVLGLQRELSIAIAEQVRQRLSPEVAAAIAQRQTQNAEAYRLYLKGRHEWTRFRPSSISDALQFYQQAVGEDPHYALAWAGIAHALITAPVTAGRASGEVYDAALDALQHALEYGPNLAETQHALGSFLFFMDWKWQEAESAARRAVALDPNNAMATMFLGIVLSLRGNHVDAAAMLQRARQLDPLFALMFANSSNVALAAGDAEAALEFARQAIAIDPEFWAGHYYLAESNSALGNVDDALSAYAVAERLRGNRPIAAKGYLLATLGRTDEARDVLAELMSRPGDREPAAYGMALVFTGLGEIDEAFVWLERAVSARSTAAMALPYDTRLEPLHSDPRYDALVARCGCWP
ncbi:MAG: winged helix-turn-helix domain-containing protein [Woeseiaceae bacterium]|nr:winged helix-turn-helix domain-containing protein [Woeseiaceae bacterium]